MREMNMNIVCVCEREIEREMNMNERKPLGEGLQALDGMREVI